MKTLSPVNNAPNAIRGLVKASCKSVPTICKEINDKFGISIHPSAIIRASTSDIGLGRVKWNALAKYFNVQPWELRDPTLPGRL